MARESLEFDAVIVGAGPAGLAAACRLGQLAAEQGQALDICVVEKAAEVGGHVVSGAVVEPRALDELFPDWRDRGAPLRTPVERDEFHWLANARRGVTMPRPLIPRVMRNRGNYIASVGRLCQWLGEQAEGLGCHVFTGCAAVEVLDDAAGRVVGVATGDMGVAADGSAKPAFQPGYELRAPWVILAEGCRGSLGKAVERRFGLRDQADPQHYGIGFKEIWSVRPARHAPGTVVHTFGWPLDGRTEGGGFLYHAEDNQISLGFIIALNYRNPHLDPFAEFQRWKHHPRIRPVLEGGRRVAYGARAVNKGGLQSLPRLSFPGGLLVGCEAGFLNGAKIKGTHTAMKTGMLAAETVFGALQTCARSEGRDERSGGGGESSARPGEGAGGGGEPSARSGEGAGRASESSAHPGEGAGRAGESSARSGEGAGRAGESSARSGEGAGRAGESSAHPGEGSGRGRDRSGSPAERSGRRGLTSFQQRVEGSWVWEELYRARNFSPGLHRLGTLPGAALAFVEHNVLMGRAPWTLRNRERDRDSLLAADRAPRLDYPRPDGTISFDRLSSVFVSNTNHVEDQPCHLRLADARIPVEQNLPKFDEPAQRYCPAAVYEIVVEARGASIASAATGVSGAAGVSGSAGTPRFVINAQNCVHCKVCDIKDPAGNIDWTPPEGGGGPNYAGM